MLIDLSFLETGQEFPPLSEYDRLETYRDNKMLFENGHAEVYERAFERISRVIENFEQVVSYPVIVNFQKLVTLKTADLLFQEPPEFTAGDDDSKETKLIKEIVSDSDLINNGYMTAIDVSRYGDGLFQVCDNGSIDVSPTRIWYKVVDTQNIKKVKYHVFAWLWASDYSTITNPYREYDRLTIQIHSKGNVETRIHSVFKGADNINYVIGNEVELPIVEKTGLSDFAIVPVSNIMTSDRIYGLNDYDDIDSIISELMVRISQISIVLDKHADPSMTGPMSALERNERTGAWELKLENYFPRDNNEEPPLEYVTWDGELTPSFTQIEKLINLLAVISEMGPAIFQDGEKWGSATSGTALRMRYIAPLAKAARFKRSFDHAMKKALSLAAELTGCKIKPSQISILWQDGLPSDPKEEAEIAQIRTGGKATMSVNRALRQYDKMTRDDAAGEIETINEEEIRSNSTMVIPPTGGDIDDNE